MTTTSELWNFFDKVPNTTDARCHFCFKLYSYKTSITNLKKHLQYKHSDSVNIGDVQNQTSSKKESAASASEDEESNSLEPDSELWGFYDKEPYNRAKCSMCGEHLKRDSDILYKHLKEKHSKISQNLEIKDNDENYTEVIYLEEPLEVLKTDSKSERVLSEVQPNARKPMKRRKSTRHDFTNFQQINNEHNDDTEVENFGKYITGLLKGIPRVASSKLQMEIVSLIMKSKISLPTTADIDSEVGERSKEPPPDIGQENLDETENIETTTSSDIKTSKQDSPPSKRPKRRFSYREEYSFKANLTENEEKEVDNFGKYVTSLLKTVPQNTISSKLQMEIVNLIMTARLQVMQKNAPVLTINGTIELQNMNTENPSGLNE